MKKKALEEMTLSELESHAEHLLTDLQNVRELLRKLSNLSSKIGGIAVGNTAASIASVAPLAHLYMPSGDVPSNQQTLVEFGNIGGAGPEDEPIVRLLDPSEFNE